ncbi:hypothetical protein KY285_007472 [Solanum tuberosum]|nr:hypothetical protein KY289_007838 [Solanum tuberosum]KAH0745815.1 hypothetical protein KY285_007472 [Solanum tuberosum]
MAWTFEVIPHLRHQVTTTEEEISSPRILRWLRAKNVYHDPAIFNPPHDIASCASMACPNRKGIANAISDYSRDDMVDAAVRADVNIGVGAGVGFGVQSVGAISCSRCTDFVCEKCKKHDEFFIMYLKTLSYAVNEFKNKR